MAQKMHGMKVFDQAGAPVLEVGPHLIRSSPEFSAAIGAIAASWAQVEVNLNCLFAVLLDTTPDEAADQIRKYRSAAKAIGGMRKLAEQSLLGEELESLTKVLSQLDLLRVRRNRVQHDVWAKKGTDNQKIFSIHSDQYLAFITKLVAITGLEISEDERSRQGISLADEFAAAITNGHTIGDLQELEEELTVVSKSLLAATFSRISQRLTAR